MALTLIVVTDIGMLTDIDLCKESNVTQSEIGSKIAPQGPPS